MIIFHPLLLICVPYCNYYPTETKFLLMFLRGAKFSQLKARKMIEGNMTIHTKYPDWFQNLDTRDKKLQEVINAGYV